MDRHNPLKREYATSFPVRGMDGGAAVGIKVYSKRASESKQSRGQHKRGSKDWGQRERKEELIFSSQ